MRIVRIVLIVIVLVLVTALASAKEVGLTEGIVTEKELKIEGEGATAIFHSKLARKHAKAYRKAKRRRNRLIKRLKRDRKNAMRGVNRSCPTYRGYPTKRRR